jgi:ankyrin repeat protein
MPDLPARPDLDQLRHQAKDLLRAAEHGDSEARERIRAGSGRIMLAGAQLAVARDHGFASWARLKTEVNRREILDRGDAEQLTAVLAQNPALAVDQMQHWCDHPAGAAPLNYVAMLRFDTSTKIWREVPGTARLALALLAAGAPVNGHPGEPETPLITAASYGDADVARVLIEAGADVEAAAAPDAGGIPGGTALLHAAVFGNTAVLDVLVTAGARVPDLVQAAAVGDLTGRSPAEATADARLGALIMAADHQRLTVIDQLITAGVPVDDTDSWGRHPLRTAAENGRAASVQRLLEHGADPTRTDARGRTPLQLSRAGQLSHPTDPGHSQVQALLQRPPGLARNPGRSG